MSSKFQKSPENMPSGQQQSIFMQRSAPVNPLQALGNLHMLNSANYGPPVSTSYLQHGSLAAPGPTLNRGSPPPLPARDDRIMNRQYGYGSPGMNSYYGSPYGVRRYVPGMHNSGYYSPYSNFRSPYGPYGAPDDSYNSFLQMAEENTRPAFESIESVVQVVNSISMMLESTYGAIYGSYSAILGVVSQFSQLKSHFAEVLSVLSLLKGLRWLCLKVLYLLGLRKMNPSDDVVWRTAHKAAVNGELATQARGSAWPFFMFLSLVVGAPWLTFRLLSKSVAAKPATDPSAWTYANNQVPYAIAAYDFNASRAGDISVRTGQKLLISPKDTNSRNNWILVANEQGETGLVPRNYLKNLKLRSVRSSNTDNTQVNPPASEEPVHNDVSAAQGVFNAVPQSEVLPGTSEDACALSSKSAAAKSVVLVPKVNPAETKSSSSPRKVFIFGQKNDANEASSQKDDSNQSNP